ncbi:hypothetical protein HDU67_001010 [Dinochytrium kinnereticum]|nr:hypothetical protein HDU67_001010 [Dinochytrium kinnereticum]
MTGMLRVFITNFIHLPLAMAPLYITTGGTFPHTSAFSDHVAWSWESPYCSAPAASSSASSVISQMVESAAASSHAVRKVVLAAVVFEGGEERERGAVGRGREMRESWRGALSVVDAAARGI